MQLFYHMTNPQSYTTLIQIETAKGNCMCRGSQLERETTSQKETEGSVSGKRKSRGRERARAREQKGEHTQRISRSELFLSKNKNKFYTYTIMYF